MGRVAGNLDKSTGGGKQKETEKRGEGQSCAWAAAWFICGGDGHKSGTQGAVLRLHQSTSFMPALAGQMNTQAPNASTAGDCPAAQLSGDGLWRMEFLPLHIDSSQGKYFLSSIILIFSLNEQNNCSNVLPLSQFQQGRILSIF